MSAGFEQNQKEKSLSNRQKFQKNSENAYQRQQARQASRYQQPSSNNEGAGMTEALGALTTIMGGVNSSAQTGNNGSNTGVPYSVAPSVPLDLVARRYDSGSIPIENICTVGPDKDGTVRRHC